ncbi:MAG: Glyoxalase/bleomycin resistance protein/dioxygenase [Thermoleophilia bacterium]|nr:Glyoxalase/bleomycin resistance protein/dioxygenase [Thermoleophilia bacterium]
MTATATTNRTFFVTIPVADVARSKAFFEKLGFEFNPAFSGEGAECMLLNEHTMVMLGSHASFAQHSHRPMGDATTSALALYSFGVPTREDVDTVAAAALAEGATEADGAEDHGFMYTRSFFDLDGHGWQVMWMDPAAQG